MTGVGSTAIRTSPVVLVSVVAGILAAVVVGRLLGVDSRLRTLIGAGTTFCGASAIAAVGPVIGASALELRTRSRRSSSST